MPPRAGRRPLPPMLPTSPFAEDAMCSLFRQKAYESSKPTGHCYLLGYAANLAVVPLCCFATLHPHKDLPERGDLLLVGPLVCIYLL